MLAICSPPQYAYPEQTKPGYANQESETGTAIVKNISRLLDVETWVAEDRFDFKHARPASEQPVSPWRQYGTVLVFLLTFVALGVNQIVVQNDPEQSDIPGYLLEALRIAEFGGILAWPGMVISGDYYQALQNPLYLLSLSPFAGHDQNFMIRAQFVSLFFGCAAIVVGYFYIQRLYSQLVAAIATAGFLATHLFIEWSTVVACESLLVLLSIGGVIAILQGFRDRRYWWLAGFLLGLAYMTKITTVFLLPGFVVAVLLTLRLEAFRTREFYGFFAAFLIASSPFMINNTIIYGNPVYHVAIDNLLNDGDGIEYYEMSIRKGAMIAAYSDSAPSKQGSRIAFQVSDIPELAGSIVRRLPREVGMFLETFSPWGLRWGPMPVRWAFGAIVVGLFLVGLRREKNIGSQIYIGATVLAFLLALSLHRPLPRYLLPIMFFVWVYAAIGGIYLFEVLSRSVKIGNKDPGALLNGAVAAGVAFLGLFIVSTKPLGDAPTSIYISPHRVELLQWMRDNIGELDRYVEGPNFRWLLRDGVFLYPPGEVRESRDRFDAFVRHHDVRYVIAEMESMHRHRYRGGQIDRQLKFEGILQFDQKRGIQELEIPDGWTKVAEDSDGIVEYIVYEVSAGTQSTG